MARDPGRRFASAEELFLRLVPFGARDYSGELAGGPGRASAPAHAAPLSPAPREAPSATSASSSTVLGMEKGRRRSRLPIIAGTVAATLLLAVSTILVTQRLPGGGEAKDAAPRAAAAQKAAAPVEKPQQPAAQQEKKAFVLTITAAPREAVIKLDGAPLAGNPARATLAGGEEHVVSAEAAGFEPQEKRVSLVKDADVSFDLVPTAPPPPAVEAKKKPAAQKAALPLAAPTPAPQEEKPGKKTLDEDWNDVAKGKGTKKAITEGWEEVGKPGPK